MVVLGVDPGTASTGYGVVQVQGSRSVALDGGTITTPPDDPLERRLVEIHSRILELLISHRPAALAVEEIYFGRNVRTAFAVGQARGVVLLAAGTAGVPCFTYTPQAIKNGVCGSGRAGKEQVKRMVCALLGLTRPPSSDHAADALAVAICHTNHAALSATLRR